MFGLIPWLVRQAFRGVRWALANSQVVVALLVVGGCLAAVAAIAVRSRVFRVARIEVPPGIEVELPASLIGRSIWAVDLKTLAADLKTQHRHLKRVRVIRRLPQTLQVDVLERIPVAQVKLAQWHLVDGEGFVLQAGRPKPWDQFVILKGVDALGSPLKVGREHASEPMYRALRLVARLKGSLLLIGHRLTAVDVSNPRQLKLVIDDIEVRCGGEEQLAVQLDRLHAALKTVASHPMAIRYIDVRFQDPVIGPNT